MLIIVLIIEVLVVVAILSIVHKADHAREIGDGLMFLAFIAFLAFMATISFGIGFVSMIPTYNSIEKRIEIIEQENTEMMENINNSVNSYYKTTEDVYAQIKSGTLFVEYPEIKSEIMEKQMDTIIENNKEIKEEKLKRENLKANLHFWLFYG